MEKTFGSDDDYLEQDYKNQGEASAGARKKKKRRNSYIDSIIGSIGWNKKNKVDPDTGFFGKGR